jgi:hypothetical protein
VRDDLADDVIGEPGRLLHTLVFLASSTRSINC